MVLLCDWEIIAYWEEKSFWMDFEDFFIVDAFKVYAREKFYHDVWRKEKEESSMDLCISWEGNGWDLGAWQVVDNSSTMNRREAL